MSAARLLSLISGEAFARAQDTPDRSANEAKTQDQQA
jgi:hypothetical protein